MPHPWSLVHTPRPILVSLLLCAVWSLALMLSACGPAEPQTKSGLSVVVTIPPLEGLVRSLLPEGSTIRTLMPPGRSEHGFEFAPSDIAAIAKADLVVLVGLELEPRVERELVDRPRPGRLVVCFADVVGLKQHVAHQHDDHEDHAHDAHGPDWVDQHLWLDPALVARLVPAIRDAVAQAAGAPVSPATSEREADLLRRINQIDAEYAQRLAPLKGAVVITNHNAFSRIADRYGLTIGATIRELESSEPSPSVIAGIVEKLKSGGVRAIFVEPQMSQSAARRIAEQGGVRVGTLDPLGSGDWFELMRSNLDQLVTALSPAGNGGSP